MSSALIDPELETFPNRYRWTVEACYKLMELGFLEGRFEVIDGEVISKMAQNPSHAACMTRLTSILVAAFGSAHLRITSPVELPGDDSIYTQPEPDAAVTSLPVSAYDGRHPQSDEVLLVVEVSDTTLKTDLGVKSRLYARGSIAEYWVIDVKLRRLNIHRKPVDGLYTDVTVHTEMDIVPFLARPDVHVAVADLFSASNTT